jgi:hypothetical protein
MINLIVFALLLFAALPCLVDWRKGMFICVMVGFLQDPFRKLIEGEPVIFTVMVVFFAAFTFVSGKLQGRRFSIRQIQAWDSPMRKPLQMFAVLVVLQSFAAFVTTGSIRIAGIGLLAYLSPLPALLLAYYFAKDEKDIFKFMKFYLAVAVVIMSGIYLSYFGYDWDVLRQVGSGLIAYAPTGEQLKLYPGFLRTPETAAWHAGTAVCFMVFLFVSQRRTAALSWFSGFIILILMGAIILTGRRKILVEIVLFMTIFGFFLVYFRRGAVKLSLLLLVIGASFAFAGNKYLFSDEATTNIGFNPYYMRGVSVRQDAPERLYNMTIGSFRWVIASNGFFGSGAGVGSQGSQHFGSGSGTGGAAEGGLGKILAELGVPGMALFLWILIELLRYLWNVMKSMKDSSQIHARLLYGMVSFMIANVIVFATAHQVFGDPFVLLILGWILGFTLAIAALGEQKKNSLKQDTLIKKKYAGLLARRGIE